MLIQSDDTRIKFKLRPMLIFSFHLLSDEIIETRKLSKLNKILIQLKLKNILKLLNPLKVTFKMKIE